MFAPHSAPVLGIDVAKAELVAALVEPLTEKTRWTRTVPNTPAGVQQLLRHTTPEMPWVVEPTGRYSELVVTLGLAAARPVLMAQPKKALRFLQSENDRVKSDRVDARGLGLYGLNRPLRAFRVKSDTVVQLEQLQAARKGLALAIQRLTLQAQSLPLAAAGLHTAIADLERQKQEFDTQIAALLAEPEQRALTTRLQAIPGIGPVTSAALVACLRDRDFGDSDALVAYVGFAVAVRESGKWRGKRKLTKHGDAELRRLLYLAARSNLRSKDSPFRAQYERERAKGLSSTAALCAVARKLLRLCWSLWKHETDYDPARVYQPPQERSGRAVPGPQPVPESTSPAAEVPTVETRILC
jgi:transposase